MTEAVERKAPRNLTLVATHVSQGAVLREYDGWILPATYGDPSAEYSAVRHEGTGLIDLSSRGRLRINGSEAVQFLNGLITNDVKTLAEGSWMTAAFPNVQGRLLALARVAHDEDGFLIDTEPTSYEKVLQTLNRFTLAGDFHVTNLHDETCLLSLQGRSAEVTLRAVLKEDFSSLKQYAVRRTGNTKAEMIVMRATHTAEDGFDLIVGSEQANDLWKAFTEVGVKPIGREALEILRIEAGLPSYGVDMDETRIVTEANLDDAISYTKGCYIGQEIIARIHWRGHVAKKLTGVIFDATENVAPDTRIRSAEGQEIGKITSSVYSPVLDQTIAMAYVKYDYLKPGTEAHVVIEGQQLSGQIAELPFVRGSWYESPEG